MVARNPDEEYRTATPLELFSGRIFVGVRVDLAKVSGERARELVEHAWRNKAPKRLVAAYDEGR